MLQFDHALKIDCYPVQSGRKKIFSAWAEKHDTHILYDLINPYVYFTCEEDLIMFKLEFGGEKVVV